MYSDKVNLSAKSFFIGKEVLILSLTAFQDTSVLLKHYSAHKCLQEDLSEDKENLADVILETFRQYLTLKKDVK